MLKRRRIKQQFTLQERLVDWARKVEVEAAALPLGQERDGLLKKMRQANVASHLADWANSPGLRPPK